MRLFVAVNLPETLTRALGVVMDGLRDGGIEARWVDPPQVHLTMKFLGEVPAERLAPAIHATDEAVAGAAPFTLGLGAAGVFPSDRPRAIWLGVVEGAPEAAALQARVETAFADDGFPQESRPFVPHLTIGRPHKPHRDPRLAEAVARLANERFGETAVTAIHLMESVLTPAGPIYRPLHEARFRDHRG